MAGVRGGIVLACLLGWSSLAAAGFEAGRAALHLRDYGLAVREFHSGAEAGEAKAQYALGLLHFYGLGVRKDDTESLRYFKLAAEQGHAQAQYNYSVMVFMGSGQPKDFATALLWMEKAADSGLPQAQSDAAYLSLTLVEARERGYQKAVGWLQKAADQGHMYAQFNLACAYLRGGAEIFRTPGGRSRVMALIPKDEEKAVHWFREAAGRGVVLAQFNLGLLYEQGRGVERDPVQAARWYEAAVRANFVFAFNNLAKLYESGAVAAPPDLQPHVLRMRASQRGYSWQQTDAILMLHFGSRVTPQGPEIEQIPGKIKETASPTYGRPGLLLDPDLRMP